MMRFALLALVLLQGENAKPRYASNLGARDKVYTETKLGIKITGPEQLAGFVRSMHPFLSMEKLVVRAEGGLQVVGKNRRKVDHDEARVEMRYDDDDHDYDYAKGQPAESDK